MVIRFSNFRFLLVVLAAWAAMCGPQRAFAGGTSYEAQIGGFMHASLKTIIVGELAGRKQSQAYPESPVPVCQPSDFADLPAAAKDDAAFDAFYRRCRFVEVKRGETHVVGTAYLPNGYCETVKKAYDDMLTKHVYAVTDDFEKNWVRFQYKGSRYEATRGHLARGAQLQTVCNDDGSISISAPRKKYRRQ